MRKPLRLLVGGGAVAAMLAAATGPAQAHPGRTVFSAGHVDVVDVEYEDGALEIGVHDENADAEYAAADVLLLVKNQARTTVPDDPAYAFLGDAGADVWVLPQVQNPDLLWPGLSTEELEAGVFADDTVTLHVDGVRGPGGVALFDQDAVGAPEVLVDSTDGLPDTVALSAGGHRHTSWAFGKAGIYRLTVSASATLADTGTTVTSEPVVYTIKVQR